MVVSNIASVDDACRDQGVFERLFQINEQVMKQSGIEHGICIASITNRAAQRVYLKAGMQVCGVIPGGELSQNERGDHQFVPDVYFYKFINGGDRKLISEANWDLEPEVAEFIKRQKGPLV